MIKCLNCEAENEDAAEHCKDCQANLKLRKYSRDDDPVTKNAALETELAKTKADLEEERKKNVQPAAPATPKKRLSFFG